MGTKQKQKQIRLIMDALNWSYTQLADIVYEELYCSEHEDFTILIKTSWQNFVPR